MTKDQVYCEQDEAEIKKLLEGRRIIRADVTDYTLVLDNGTRIRVDPNEGCPGCSSGNYDITIFDECESVITSVRTAVEEHREDESWDFLTRYQIWVLVADREFPILEVSGTDGNGYYGTGYRLYVTVPR